jgi:hypothetical protein
MPRPQIFEGGPLALGVQGYRDTELIFRYKNCMRPQRAAVVENGLVHEAAPSRGGVKYFILNYCIALSGIRTAALTVLKH